MKRAPEAQRRKAIALLRAGHSTRRVAAIIGRHHSWVAKLAKREGIRCESTMLSGFKRMQVSRMAAEGYSVGEIAKRTGVSQSTASKYRRLHTAEKGEIAFHRTRAPRSCSIHGPVTVWPCVACAATNAA